MTATASGRCRPPVAGELRWQALTDVATSSTHAMVRRGWRSSSLALRERVRLQPARSRLPDRHVQDRGAVRGRRADRRGRAHPGRTAVRALGRQVGDHRKPARAPAPSSRPPRSRRRRPTATRVLIATNSLLINPGDRPDAALRHAQGSCAGQHDRDPAGCAGRQQGVPGQHVAELVALARNTPAQLHLARPARRRASRRRVAQAARRHRDDPHQLQRQRAGTDRRDRRPRADHVRRLAFGQALCRFRRAQADRRRRGRSARRRAAVAHHCGDLSGLRRDRVQRVGRAGRRPGAGAGEALGRHPRGGRLAPTSPSESRTSGSSRRQHAAGARRLDARARSRAGRRSPRRPTSRPSDGHVGERLAPSTATFIRPSRTSRRCCPISTSTGATRSRSAASPRSNPSAIRPTRRSARGRTGAGRRPRGDRCCAGARSRCSTAGARASRSAIASTASNCCSTRTWRPRSRARSMTGSRKEWLDRDPRLRASIVMPAAERRICGRRDRALRQRPALRAGAGARHGRDAARAPALLADLCGGRAPWLAASASMPGASYRHPVTSLGWPSYYIEDYASQSQGFQSQVASLICEGVFAKYPKTQGGADRIRRHVAARLPVAVLEILARPAHRSPLGRPLAGRDRARPCPPDDPAARCAGRSRAGGTGHRASAFRRYAALRLGFPALAVRRRRPDAPWNSGSLA